jgi:gamma-glutamyltranspeptidase/glutathione hydrolase
MPFGVMGGQYQATGHVRIPIKYIRFGMDIQTALDSPRSFFENGSLRIEEDIVKAPFKSYPDVGHSIEQDIGPIGGAQAIKICENGVLEGASDPRKDGCALGY